MSEKIESPEKISIAEQAVIEVLNRNGIDNPEAKNLLAQYIQQCEHEADAKASADPTNPELSNRANIEAALKVAILYSKTETCKKQARVALEDVYLAATQTEATNDLAEHAASILADFYS